MSSQYTFEHFFIPLSDFKDLHSTVKNELFLEGIKKGTKKCQLIDKLTTQTMHTQNHFKLIFQQIIWSARTI